MLVDVEVLVDELVLVVEVVVEVVLVEVLVVVVTAANTQFLPLNTHHLLFELSKKKSPATGSTGKVLGLTALLDVKLDKCVSLIIILLYSYSY